MQVQTAMDARSDGVFFFSSLKKQSLGESPSYAESPNSPMSSSAFGGTKNATPPSVSNMKGASIGDYPLPLYPISLAAVSRLRTPLPTSEKPTSKSGWGSPPPPGIQGH